MLICAIDTSGRDGSLALARGDASSLEPVALAPIAGGTYSAQLIPCLSSALQSNALDKSAIDLFVVASGPGSFTGLRVGISTVKALAVAFQKPVVAVSVLEAVAWAAGRTGHVLAALDAQRQEIYIGEYECSHADSNYTPRGHRESLMPVAELIAWLAGHSSPPLVVTPDAGVERQLHGAGLAVQTIPRPSAEIYAKLGLRKYLGGETVVLDELDANYIRRSDAEIFSSPKLGIPGH